jgi:photosystem II stability/assembly factor-like uncharacterized protein
VIGGTQDNGTVLYSGSPSWTQIRGGDGGGTLIDQATPTTFYHTFPFLSPERSDDGRQTWNDISFFIGDVRSTFYPPLVMGPAIFSIIGTGGSGLWLSGDRGASWVFFSVPEPLQFGTCAAGRFSKVTAIGLTLSLAPVYVGREEGGGVVTTTDGFFWAYANTGLPANLPFVTDLTVLANDPNSACLTMSGFGGAHVFRTTNAGQSWQNISGNLPNTPVNSIVVDPAHPTTHLFVGTDAGAFETTNGGASWSRAGTGLPNVSVFMLRLQNSTGTLFAATHGRGVFTLAGAAVPSPEWNPKGHGVFSRAAQWGGADSFLSVGWLISRRLTAREMKFARTRANSTEEKAN